MSYSDEVTDKELKKLERKIKAVYRQAYVEMKAKAKEYFDTLDHVRYQQEYKAYKAGKYTKAEFDLWYKTQIERGHRYEHMRDQLAKRMTEANKVASAYINDSTPSIASINYNYQAYEIAQAYGVDFTIADEQTIKSLLMDENHVEFRTTRVDQNRDYEWNREQITKALTSAIVQGKSIDKLADSFLHVMKRNSASAIRNARTAYTSAQNGGRQAGYNQAVKMGIQLKKEWIATLDERTRISHALLDGKRVDHDKPFSNGLMYPADPSGSPREVYNCRCTMRAILPNVNDEQRETYGDWVKRMEAKQIAPTLGDLQRQPDLQKAIDRWNDSVYSDSFGKRVEIIDPTKLSRTMLEIIAETDDKKQLRKIQDIVSPIFDSESRWNGNISYDENMDAGARIAPDGTIILKSTSTIKNKVHEVVHSYSPVIISDIKEQKIVARRIEEASTEIIAEKICMDHGIMFSGSYHKIVSDMIRMADTLGRSSYDLALELKKMNPLDRSEYLKGLLDD